MNDTLSSSRLSQAEELYQRSLTNPESVLGELDVVVSNLKCGLTETVESPLLAARVQMVASKTLRQLTFLSTPIEELVGYQQELIEVVEARQKKLNAAARAERMTGITRLLEAAQLNTLQSLQTLWSIPKEADWVSFLNLYPQFITESTSPDLTYQYLTHVERILNRYEKRATDHIGDLRPPLTADEPLVRQQAIDVLTTLATTDPTTAADYVSDVVSLLGSSRTELTVAALSVCRELVTTAPELITSFSDEIRERLSSDLRIVRWKALQTVSIHPDIADSRTQQLLTEVTRALDASDPDTRQLAAETLQQCPSLIPTKTLPIEPLIEHQSLEDKKFTRAVHEILREVAEEHPERVTPYLDTILNPAVSDNSVEQMLVTLMGFTIAKSDAELLLPHIDRFVSIVLSREDRTSDLAASVDEFTRQFSEAAAVSQNPASNLETLRTKRAYDRSYRRVTNKSDFEVDANSNEMHRRSAIGVLSILARSAPKSPEVKRGIQAVSTALFVENDAIRNRAIVGLDSVLNTDRTALIEFIPLYLRAVQQYTTENKPAIRRRVLMILAQSCEAAYQEDAVRVFTQTSLKQILELAPKLDTHDSTLHPLDQQLIAHIIKNATRTVLNNHTEVDSIDFETPSGTQSPTSPEKTLNVHSPAPKTQSTALLTEHIFDLAAAPRRYTTHALFKVLQSWTDEAPRSIIPHVPRIVDAIAELPNQEHPEAHAATKEYRDTLRTTTLIATEDAPEDTDAIANTLVASADETIEAGFALVNAIARTAPAALLPHIDKVQSLATDPDIPSAKHLYGALRSIAHAYPSQTTDLNTTFVDGLYKSDVVGEISSEALTTLATTNPTIVSPHLTSLAATLRTNASAATLLNASYTLRLLAEADPTIVDEVADTIQAQMPITTPEPARLTEAPEPQPGPAPEIITVTQPTTELIREQLDACLRIHNQW